MAISPRNHINYVILDSFNKGYLKCKWVCADVSDYRYIDVKLFLLKLGLQLQNLVNVKI